MTIETPIPGCVSVTHGFLSDQEATALYEALRTEIGWQQKHVAFYGKRYPIPRLTAWCGDPGTTYTYSDIRHEAEPWTPALAALKPRLDALLPAGRTFNGVLLNYYRDGSDKIHFHSDDEPELGPRPFIASLSLGAQRRFRLKRRDKTPGNVEIPLENGTLVCMYGLCQQEWVHSVPSTTAPTSGRINLTLRQVV